MRIRDSYLRQIIREEIRSRLLREQDEQADVMDFGTEEIVVRVPSKGQKISNDEAEALFMQGPDAFDSFLNNIPDAAERARTEAQLRQMVKTADIPLGLIKAISDYIVFGSDVPLASAGGMTPRESWLRFVKMQNR